MRKLHYRALLLLGLITMLAAQVQAQTRSGQKLLVDFVDGSNFTYFDSNGVAYTYPSGVLEGDELPVGATLQTGAGTSVELRISPNGTLLKLAANTVFQVQAVASQDSNRNAFTLVAGKVRTLAAKGSNYEILTASTVCGVRGTDFTMAYAEGSKALLLVKEGAVEFGERGADGMVNQIMVLAGQFADFYTGLTAQPFSQALFDLEYGDMDIPPERLPTETIATGDTPAESSGSAGAAASPAPPATGGAVTGSPAPAPVSAAGQPEPDGAQPASDTSAAEAASQVPAIPGDNPFFAWLQEILGIEFGTIGIGDQIWSKAVLQPSFNIGRLRMSLYLPIIYANNLFDPDQWYKPAGNNEWSFGTDVGWQEEPFDALVDAGKDLALKIRYVEFGNQQTDPFFFKAGNVNSFTIGHGLLMRNYANDSDFPAIRHLGFNLGLDLGGWGFEFLTNDLTAMEILGTRLFARPIPGSKFALGLSAVADLFPARGFETPATYGDPVFTGAGLDLDLPLISASAFGLKLFADGAVMLPYVRESYTYNDRSRDPGFTFDLVYNNGTVSNWGASGGLLGNVFMVHYRLEYRYFTGIFQPSFFDAGYERRRMSEVTRYAAYLADPTLIAQTATMGVYGEGGAKLFSDKLNFTLGYFWPIDLSSAAAAAMPEDYFKAELAILKGLIPLVDVYGSIRYERKNFVPTLLQQGSETLGLFDENTVFGGELVVPIPGVSFVSLAVQVSTTLARDELGQILQENGKPVMQPVVTLETRLRF